MLEIVVVPPFVMLNVLDSVSPGFARLLSSGPSVHVPDAPVQERIKRCKARSCHGTQTAHARKSCHKVPGQECAPPSIAILVVSRKRAVGAVEVKNQVGVYKYGNS